MEAVGDESVVGGDVELVWTGPVVLFPSGPNSSLAMIGDAKAPAAKLKCRACM